VGLFSKRSQHRQADQATGPNAAATKVARTPDFVRQVPADTGFYDIDAQLIANALADNGDVPDDALFTCDSTGAWSRKRLRIKGQLNLESVRFSRPLALVGCEFEDAIILSDARLGALDLRSTSLKGIFAKGIRIDGDLDLSLATSSEPIDLDNAKIDGDLIVDGATVRGPDFALRFEHATIQGALSFQSIEKTPFQAYGEVSGIGALIDGQVHINGAKFHGIDHGTNYALSLEGSTIKGTTFFRNKVHFAGTLSFAGAHLAAIEDSEDCWPKRGKLLLNGLTYTRFTASSPTTGHERLQWIKRQ
jgi:hypothetical protein